MSSSAVNRWTVESDPLLAWDAVAQGTGWWQPVVEAGERTGAFVVQAAARLGYDRAGDGPFPQFTAGLAHQLGSRGPFLLDLRTASVVAAFGPDGSVVEHLTADLGELPAARIAHAPPLTVYTHDETPGAVRVRVTSPSDIWLPWCSARYEDGARPDDLADNRELAARNGPRLNAFLGELARVADVTLDQSTTDPVLAYQLHDTGVDLDAAEALDRTTWEPFGTPGERDLPGALRRAARRVAADPPVPPYRAVVGAHHRTGPELDRAAVLAALHRDGPRAAELPNIVAVRVETGQVTHVLSITDLRP